MDECKCTCQLEGNHSHLITYSITSSSVRTKYFEIYVCGVFLKVPLTNVNRGLECLSEDSQFDTFVGNQLDTHTPSGKCEEIDKNEFIIDVNYSGDVTEKHKESNWAIL